MWFFTKRPKEVLNRSSYAKLLIAIAIPYTVGIVGMIIGLAYGAEWYRGIEKSVITLPDSVYKPVWSLLYVLMGISLFMVWTTKISISKVRAYVAFGVQLALNFAWPIMFFAFHSKVGAFLVDIFLFFAILWTIYEFAKISQRAAYLLVPYAVWVLAATAIAFSLI